MKLALLLVLAAAAVLPFWLLNGGQRDGLWLLALALVTAGLLVALARLRRTS